MNYYYVCTHLREQRDNNTAASRRRFLQIFRVVNILVCNNRRTHTLASLVFRQTNYNKSVVISASSIPKRVQIA